MTRQQISNGSHFSPEAATKFNEDTTWDERNHISVCTGSQWAHEALYLTRKGSWILNEWSQWQGSTEKFEKIDEDRAIDWLILNRCDVSALDETLQARIEQAIAAQEV